MKTIGLLCSEEIPDYFNLANLYSLIGKMKNVNILYFTPSKIDTKNESIHGFLYKEGSWQQKRMPFPAIIYNLCSPSKEVLAMVNDLKNKITIINVPLKNWVDVYDKIINHDRLKEHLIPTIRLKTSGHFLRLLSDYRRVILKPIENNVFSEPILIEQKGATNFVTSRTQNMELHQEQVRLFVRQKIIAEPHYIQPFILCQTPERNHFHLQIQLQKNYKHQWNVINICPVIAPNGTVTSTIINGAYTQQLLPFLERNYEDSAHPIKEKLELFAQQFAFEISQDEEWLSKATQRMTISVVLDDLHHIWVCDCVSPSLYISLMNGFEVKHIMNDLDYVIFFANYEK